MTFKSVKAFIVALFVLGVAILSSAASVPGQLQFITSAASDISADSTLPVILANPGEVILSWTAPGDDGSHGTINHYVIKYSSSMISEVNWGMAIAAPNPPAPLPAGSRQSITITGLGRGLPNYFAMKSYDEAGVASSLSNVIRKFSGGIITPSLRRAAIDTAQVAATLKADTVVAGMRVKYQFALDISNAFSAPVISVDSLIDSLAFVTYPNLDRGVRYYWRCRALAQNFSDSSLWSLPDSFSIQGIAGNDTPHVAVTSPNGAEIWNSFSTHSITWTSSDSNGVASHKLEYSTDAGSTWLLIRDWTSGDPHSYSWVLPNIFSTQVRVRVSCRDATGLTGIDISNGNFTIRDNTPPTVRVIAPNGGQSWVIGTIQAISWSDSDNIAVVSHKIEFSTNRGTSWILVRDWTNGDPHTYSWTIPNTPSRYCRVRLSVRDGSGNTISDNSNSNFRIRTAAILPGDPGYTPEDYFLAQSYPNPFNAVTKIDYGLPDPSHVTLIVYDITGRLVETLVDEYQDAGLHSVTWNSGDEPSGTYLYRIAAGDYSETMKMTVVK
jgi:hypothetical protein